MINRGVLVILRLTGLAWLVTCSLLYLSRSHAQSCANCTRTCNAELSCNGGAYASADYCAYPDTGCYTGYPASNGCCCNDSPVLIDVEGEGFNLTSPDDGVHFQMGPISPTHYKVSWTSAQSHNAWLVLDRDGNGTVDNLKELFGNQTEQPSSDDPNGFRALAVFDALDKGGNKDGIIDEKDSIFQSLRLWQDLNHDGVSQAAELYTLPSLGIRGISLDYQLSKKVDDNGNHFRYRAKVLRTSSSDAAVWAWDVFLQTHLAN